MSPLYVSVHSTDPCLRARMLGRKKADDLEQKLKKLIRGGIQIHAQVVLMPGINDGIHLQKTVFDLYALYPDLQSIAVVPLGLSDHGTIKGRFAPVTRTFSRGLILQAVRWQEQFRKQVRKTFVYLADEFYILAGADLPETRHYDDFAQIEDGVGMVGNFLDEFDAALRRRRRSLTNLKGTLATGRLFFPYLWRLRGAAQCEARRFAASLRGGKSVYGQKHYGGRFARQQGAFLAALHRRNLGKFVIIPQESVSRVHGVFVDDLAPADLSRRFGIPAYLGGRTITEFFKLLFRLGSP